MAFQFSVAEMPAFFVEIEGTFGMTRFFLMKRPLKLRVCKPFLTIDFAVNILLLRLAQAIQIGGEHSLQAAAVFTVADEILQLKPQGLQLLLVLANLRHLGHAVVEQFG